MICIIAVTCVSGVDHNDFIASGEIVTIFVAAFDPRSMVLGIVVSLTKCGRCVASNGLIITRIVVFCTWNSLSCLMSNAYISTSYAKLVKLADASIGNCSRVAPTLVIPVDALVMGYNSPCLAFMVYSSQSL